MDLPALNSLLAQPKVALQWSGWQKRSNHANHVIGTAILTDTQSVTIPGLTLQLEVKAPIVAVSCLFLFSVMQFDRIKRGRVFQLEVAPPGKRTHQGLSVIYGPHEHLLGIEPTKVDDSAVNCDAWDGCLAWFLLRTSITLTESILSPLTP